MRLLRLATNEIWQRFIFPALATWIKRTLIPKLECDLSAWEGATTAETQAAEAINVCEGLLLYV